MKKINESVFQLFFHASAASFFQPTAYRLHKILYIELLLILRRSIQMRCLFYDVCNKKTLFL